MRLIDADALGDAFSEKEDRNPIDGNGGYLSIEEIYETIDSAPTIISIPNVGRERLEARQRGYNEGYQLGMKIGKGLQNPNADNVAQWLPLDLASPYKHQHVFKCSRCGSYEDYQTNFCWYCGRAMISDQAMAEKERADSFKEDQDEQE